MILCRFSSHWSVRNMQSFSIAWLQRINVKRLRVFKQNAGHWLHARIWRSIALNICSLHALYLFWPLVPLVLIWIFCQSQQLQIDFISWFLLQISSCPCLQFLQVRVSKIVGLVGLVCIWFYSESISYIVRQWRIGDLLYYSNRTLV